MHRCILSQQVASTNAILFLTFGRHKSCSTPQLAQILFFDLKRSIPTCQTMEASTKEQPEPLEHLELREPPAPTDRAAAPQPQVRLVQPDREQEPAPQRLYHKQHTTTARRSLRLLRKRKTM